MKRTIRTVLCAALAMVAAVSCQKSAEVEEPIAEKKGTIEIRVNGLMGEYAQQDGVGVKSSLVNTVRVAWENDDVVYVFDGTRYLGKLTAELDKKADGQTDEDRYAKLSGTILEPTVTPCTLSLVHSALITEPEAGAAMSELSIDMSLQSSSKVPFVAYATMEYNNETGIADAIVPFQFATSVIRVNSVGLKASTAISAVNLSNVNTACKLTFSASGVTEVAGDVIGTIIRTSNVGNVNAEGEAVFQIAVPKLGLADARTITVKQGNNYFMDKKFTEKALSPATSVNTVCQLDAFPAGALPGEFTVDDGKVVYFSRGNLWYGPATTGATATFNFEANQNNSSFGTDHKSFFYWTKTSSDAIIDHILTANNNQVLDVLFTNATETTPKEGFSVNVDGTSQSGWRTLSKNEWNFLLNTRPMKYGKDRYSFDVTLGNGWKGIVIYPDEYNQEPLSGTVSSLPDGVVFLPGAGYTIYHTSLQDYYWYYDANYGLYWTSSAGDSSVSSPTSKAYALRSRNGNYNSEVKAATRNQGYSIRLVKDI